MLMRHCVKPAANVFVLTCFFFSSLLQFWQICFRKLDTHLALNRAPPRSVMGLQSRTRLSDFTFTSLKIS